jgi:hypothetical protein
MTMWKPAKGKNTATAVTGITIFVTLSLKSLFIIKAGKFLNVLVACIKDLFLGMIKLSGTIRNSWKGFRSHQRKR